MLFCFENGKYFASFLIIKLFAKFIWNTSSASSLIDLKQNDDKFVFSRFQKPSAFTTISSRSSSMHRMFIDSFGESPASVRELLMTAEKFK